MNTSTPSVNVWHDRYGKFKRVLAEHYGVIIRTTPLCTGFLIYFIYFCQNSFFPSMDLFGFTSLLVSAFLMGMAVMGTVVLGLFFPAWNWVDACLKKKEGVWDAYISDPEKKDVFFARFILEWLGSPLLINGLIMAISWSYWRNFAVLFLLTAGVPILVGVGFSVLLKRSYQMPAGTARDYAAAIFASLLFTNGACLAFCLVWQVSMDSWNGKLSFGVLVASWAICSTGVIGNAIASMRSFLTSFLVSFFLGALIAVAMQVHVNLPPKIMTILGVGNYQSREVVLKKDACETLANSIGEIKNCAIPNAWVVWGFGDVFKLRIESPSRAKNETDGRCDAARAGCLELVLPKESTVAILR